MHWLAKFQLFQNAVSDHDGTVSLTCPQGFAENDGVATLEFSTSGQEQVIAVEAVPLDRILHDHGDFSLAKIDVEGHELRVLRGGAKFFSRQVKNIVFEDHEGPASPVAELLQRFGFTVLQFGWTLRGLKFATPAEGRLSKRYEAPNYIATKDAAEVLERVAPLDGRYFAVDHVNRWVRYGNG